MNKVPNHLRYTKTHEWLKLNDQEMVIGITEHAQMLLGDMVYVDFPAIGKKVVAGEEMGVVESVKAASDIYAPVSGTVIAVNQRVADNPALVNTDPYGEGWLVKLTPSNPEEVNGLLSAEQYQHLADEESH